MNSTWVEHCIILYCTLHYLVTIPHLHPLYLSILAPQYCNCLIERHSWKYPKITGLQNIVIFLVATCYIWDFNNKVFLKKNIYIISCLEMTYDCSWNTCKSFKWAIKIIKTVLKNHRSSETSIFFKYTFIAHLIPIKMD